MKKRIIFVDDEVRVLQGLRRMLRTMRREWEMEFVESGEAALEKLAAQTYDVIVSDMRMPRMDGAELLTCVKERYPQTVRIILSGYSEKELILKTVKPAHQYIPKPCDPESLKNAINRACALRDLLAQEHLQKLVSSMETIPSLPTVYERIMDAVRDPECSLVEIGEIIAMDLGMTAKILQLVNSAFFGIPRQITKPSEATVYLGLETIKALILTIGLFSQVDHAHVSLQFMENLYDHSLQAGVLARKIARDEELGVQSVDQSFLAGLLHDLGKLVIACNLPQHCDKIHALCEQEALPLEAAEMKILGASHADVGAYLLGIWGFPDAIVEAIAYHHRPAACLSDRFEVLGSVHVANALTNRSSAVTREATPLSDLDEAYLERLQRLQRLSHWEALLIKE